MTRRRPTLGIYCPGTGTGGPWRYVHSILGGLDPVEFDVTVFSDMVGVYEPRPWVKLVSLAAAAVPPRGTVAGHPAALAPAPRPAVRSLAARYLPAGVRLWAGYAREARRLAARFRGQRVDLLHTQGTGCEESPLASRLAGVRRLVGTFHVDSTYDLRGDRSDAGHRTIEVLSNQCLDVALAVSHATKRDWVRRTHIPADRVVTIHNGIDPDRFRRRVSRAEARRTLGLPAVGPVVGGVGRLEEAKGFADLISAVPALRAEFPELAVVIAGTGPLRDHLAAHAAALGVGNAVRFLGYLPDVQQVLDALDVFAFPSLCETIGYALLEAMATELPAVGSTVGGIPEVIVPGETGFLVPPRAPDRLAAELARLLRDPDLRQRFGAAGRARVATSFHERDMVTKTIGVYRTVLGRPAGGGRRWG